MRYSLIILYFILLSFNGYGSIKYSNDQKISSIGFDTYILEDSSNELNIQDVQKLQDFVKSSIETPNLNISQSTFWVKFTLKNNSTANDLLLEIAHPTIDKLDFFAISNNTIHYEKASEFDVFRTRKYDSPNYIFDLNLEPNEEKTYYLRIKSGEQVLLPLFVGTKKKILETGSKHEMIFGIYAGIMLIMFLYNLFVYFTVQDKSYLYYIVYILFVGLTQACIKGYAFKYLWPNIPYIAIQSMYWIPALSGITAVLFLMNFIRVKELIPWSVKGFYLILGLYITSIILSSSGYYFLSVQIIQVCALFGSLYTLFIAILVAKKGYRPAKYFLLAWSVFLTTVITYVLKTFGIVPHNSITNYLLEGGSAIETILLSFALADKINTYKQERITAIEEKENILRVQNITLEREVTERTKEISEKNEKLNQTLSKLKSTQSQLIQSEKMASLGQLTAGMAHEINNPLNYMSQGVEVLKEDINDLKDLIVKYDEVYIESNSEIEDLKKDIQIDYVYKEMDDALADIEDGINRTIGITAGLKTFSRINESDFKLASIHDNLDSTINLMKHEFAKGGISIEKTYNAVIKEIECNSGKLNQVFMNILINSTYAITNKDFNKNGKILILTESDQDNFIISIKDNGAGMSEETRNKLFDPFYTTKDVGEGTGLGMSIVHGIIDNHKGNIQVFSQLNSGTEIKIMLPINGNQLLNQEQ